MSNGVEMSKSRMKKRRRKEETGSGNKGIDVRVVRNDERCRGAKRRKKTRNREEIIKKREKKAAK